MDKVQWCREEKTAGRAEGFGAAVRRLREAQGWTQEQLAERAEMNASYLGFTERGEIPTLMIIVNLARAFDVAPSVLLIDVMKLR